MTNDQRLLTPAQSRYHTPMNRPPIHILPDSLINKIAAGEVVERPASVVKELLENSIDAGATRLAIAIEDSGRTLIRISDNGSGIPADQAPLAFAQHATSKIASAEDLFAIHTMGFRGEALASIASVSHAAMTTRTADSPQGVRIEVKDSLVGPPVPCAAPVGTTLEIRDLLYSVPARRKFLRTDPTEFGHIHEMVLRTALPNPHVGLTLTHNGRGILDLPPTADPLARVAAALGEELHDQLLALDFSERGVIVTGFAGQPALARATAKFQYLFLNGRYIRDRMIFHALKEAYRGLIEPISQPVAVLFLGLDPMMFDVNVHPQKTEVRFRDSNALYSAVLAAIRERLLASDLTPAMRTKGRTDAAPESPPTSAPDAAATSSDSAADPARTRQVIADFFKQTPPPQPRLAFGPEPSHRPIAAPAPSELAPAEPARPAAESPRFLPPPDRTVLAPADAPRFVQLHNTYLVVQTTDGVLIIDQHALHERILYEELYARITRGPLEGQRLLIPEVLPVSPRQLAALETVRPLLSDLGIDVAPFDAQSIAIHSFPSLLAKVSPRELLRDLLDKLVDIGAATAAAPSSGGGVGAVEQAGAVGGGREDLLHEVLDMASCKAAVKAGYPLSDDEIAALLARKDAIDRSSNCPHGRPTTLRLSLNDLERQFKRK